MLISCNSQDNDPENTPLAPLEVNEERQAVVTAVTVSGEERDYTFNVTLQSPDTGCDQYADWWEIIDPQFEFIYRRVLGHSHITEQPFTRSGGPVDIFEDEEVIIRGHMNSLGYGSIVFRGTVESGFFRDTLNISYDLSGVGPEPEDCAF